MATICGVGRLGREWADGHPEAEPGASNMMTPSHVASPAFPSARHRRSPIPVWVCVLGGAKGERDIEANAPGLRRGFAGWGYFSLSIPWQNRNYFPAAGLRRYYRYLLYKPQTSSVTKFGSGFPCSQTVDVGWEWSVRGRCNVGDGGRIAAVRFMRQQRGIIGPAPSTGRLASGTCPPRAHDSSQDTKGPCCDLSALPSRAVCNSPFLVSLPSICCQRPIRLGQAPRFPPTVSRSGSRTLPSQWKSPIRCGGGGFPWTQPRCMPLVVARQSRARHTHTHTHTPRSEKTTGHHAICSETIYKVPTLLTSRFAPSDRPPPFPASDRPPLSRLADAGTGERQWGTGVRPSQKTGGTSQEGQGRLRTVAMEKGPLSRLS